MRSRRLEQGAGARSGPDTTAGRGRSPRWRRALAAAAALAIAAVPWLSPDPALAASPEAAAADGAPAAPSGGKAKKKKAAAKKPAGHAETKSAEAKRGAKPADAKREAKPAEVKREGKKDGKKKGAKAAPPKPCLGPAIAIDRSGLEAERLSLLDCDGKPREQAQRRLSVLARPWGAARPSEAPKEADRGGKGKARSEKPGAHGADGAEIAPGVRLLDPGLLSRIDALARKHPGKTVSLVSGYRPQSRGSLHQSARALDLRIAGVRNEDLAAACRALPDTGCGYYPNSSFVHVDVRAPGTGTVSWIDASGPGEAPRYVSAWPPPAEEEAPAKPGDAPDAVARAAEAHDEKDAGEAAAGDDEKAPAREEQRAAVEGAKGGEEQRAAVEGAEGSEEQRAAVEGDQAVKEKRAAVEGDQGVGEGKQGDRARAGARAKDGAHRRDAAAAQEPHAKKPKRGGGKRTASRRAVTRTPEAGEGAQGAPRRR